MPKSQTKSKGKALDLPRLVLEQSDRPLAAWLREGAKRNDRKITAHIRHLLRKAMEQENAAQT